MDNEFKSGDICLETIKTYKGDIVRVNRILVDKVYEDGSILFRYLTSGYRTGELFRYRTDDPCRTFSKENP
jgi:hypothetical protein